MQPKKTISMAIAVQISLLLLFFASSTDSHHHHHHHHHENQAFLRPCYFTNWAGYRSGRAKYTPEDYVPGLCTHILYAFGGMYDNYTARSTDAVDLSGDNGAPGLYARVNALKAYQPDLKTLLSFGGWNFGTRLFVEMTSTAQNRSVFINSAIQFVRAHCFDGVDLDWEYPIASDKQNYISLLKEFEEAFAAESNSTGLPKLLLTAAVAAGKQNIDPGYDVPNMARYLDFVLLMSYDFHGTWENVTGMNSPLYARQNDSNKEFNVAAAANYWVQLGMPKSKLVIGIPTYGHGWTLLYPGTDYGVGAAASGASAALQYSQSAGTVAYYEICEMTANGSSAVYFDAESQVPYLVNGNQWFSYDDAHSVNIKVKWIKKNHFAGAFVWDLDWDDFNAKCPNSTQGKYPLIGTIARVLGHSKHISFQPSVAELQNQTTSYWQTTSAAYAVNGSCPFYRHNHQNCHHHHKHHHGGHNKGEEAGSRKNYFP